MPKYTCIVSVTFNEPTHAQESIQLMRAMESRGFLPWRPSERPDEFTNQTAYDPAKLKDWLEKELRQELNDESIVVTVTPFR
jgi:hypothetical protein